MALRISQSLRIGGFRFRVSAPLSGEREDVGVGGHQDRAARVDERVSSGHPEEAAVAVSGAGIALWLIAAVTIVASAVAVYFALDARRTLQRVRRRSR